MDFKTYVKNIIDRSLETARKETSAVLDTHQAKTDSAIASMEHKLTLQESNDRQDGLSSTESSGPNKPDI